MLSNKQLITDLTTITLDVLEQAHMRPGDTFVLGCSSSEILGQHIGKATSADIGHLIVTTLYDLLNERQIKLAVQGCEHINRSLTVELETAKEQPFDIVSVVPILNAGGACATAAHQIMQQPVQLEHIIAKGGLDIGDTNIGMHIKHVQIPIRPQLNKLGEAHVTALGSRPKLIGGIRASY
ncbi:TIGR01440 family protein [Vagococcus penaei]|uniref:UPF0340 protein BW732_09545 n=1 Tax=Vagococcus penaei TaxID=633807 RepID=A0A1Q2D8U5_9ENTE|nr:TIGR01440 family protein [Vagococcus penaei]AQP54822.1 TIGR01440 family protein [Vagococcus penaei]RSU06398.1 TIGR01440 family protein [Vagococcus penaei]